MPGAHHFGSGLRVQRVLQADQQAAESLHTLSEGCVSFAGADVSAICRMEKASGRSCLKIFTYMHL